MSGTANAQQVSAPAHGVVNVAARLGAMARERPEAAAVVEPLGYGADGRRQYRTITFRALDEDSDRVARGLIEMGVTPGTRLALLVRPGIDFVSLVFALLKSGAVTILIDPGMGKRNLIRCLAEVEPEGFVAIPPVHAVRCLLRHRFPKARHHLTVGRRWFWGGTTLAALRKTPHRGGELCQTRADDPAAIIFTTGSTGPPKGVLYRHETFDAQVRFIRDFYGIAPGEVDVAAFPLFGLFNAAMGVTAVIPEMDPTRPAKADPAKIVEAIRDWQATQAFGSPAVWNRVGPYCREQGIRLETLRRVLSAGAPVPIGVLEGMMACIHPEGDVHTPYGATEALPVASIGARTVLGETAARTRLGQGVCVGHRFGGIRWKVVRIVDGPLTALDQAEELPPGEIGELIVSGPQVTRQYVNRHHANALGKIAEGDEVWHRMGDAGYLDETDRFWFCGRVAHRLLTAVGPMYTIPCEAIFNSHPAVARSALVGVGEPSRQHPVLVVEPADRRLLTDAAFRESVFGELREMAVAHPHTASIEQFLVHPAFPVDIRHNVKIFREKLAVWAAGRVARR